MAKTARPNIKSREDFKAWLKGQPDGWAHVIASRIALRVLPVTLNLKPTKRDLESEDDLLKRTRSNRLNVFRANLVVRTAVKYPTREIRNAVNDVFVGGGSYLSVARAAADAIFFDSHAIIPSFLPGASPDPPAVLAADYAANLVNDAATIWRSIDEDTVHLRNRRSQYEPQQNTPVLFREPLWLGQAPKWADEAFAAMRAKLFADDTNWNVWLGWYKSLLGDRETGMASIWFNERLNLRIATQHVEFWSRDAILVNAEITNWRKEWRNAVAGLPKPSENAKSPTEYRWTDSGTIGAAGGALNRIFVPENRSPRDAQDRLRAGRQLALDAAMLCGKKPINVRTDYPASLTRYAERLPGNTYGDIYLADSEARWLRKQLEKDIKYGLDDEIAQRLVVFLEHHQGLRPYFPDLMNFYDDVRKGQLAEPFPLDVVAQLETVIDDNTPETFESEVSGSLNDLENSGAALRDVPTDKPAEPEESAIEIKLPADPIADIDPAQATRQAKAGALNKVYDLLLKSEKWAKNVERAEKVAQTFGRIIKPVIDWLDKLPPPS